MGCPTNRQQRQESVHPSCDTARLPGSGGSSGSCPRPATGMTSPHTMASPRCCSPTSLRPPRETDGVESGKQEKQAQVFDGLEFYRICYRPLFFTEGLPVFV